jgi:hypothetical protein
MSLPKPATVLHAQKLGTDIVNTNHSAILLNFPKSFITCPTIAEYTVDLPSQIETYLRTVKARTRPALGL